MIPTHRRLLLVDTDMGHETVDKIRACKQDDVEFCNMSFSNLDECCGVMRDIVAGCGGSINYVGIATHEANLRGNSLLNTRFIEGIRGLFPLPEDRVLTSAVVKVVYLDNNPVKWCHLAVINLSLRPGWLAPYADAIANVHPFNHIGYQVVF